jgi:hypothetical protein
VSVRNSDRFIFAYNRIEKAMEKMSGLTDYMPFSRLIDKTKKNSAVIRKFEEICGFMQICGMRLCIIGLMLNMLSLNLTIT